MTGCVMGATAVAVPDPVVSNPPVVTAVNASGADAGFASSGVVFTSTGPNTNVSGGVPPYTFQWTQSGGVASGGPFSISSATAQNPTWNDLREATHPDNDENWQVEVTDDEGATATDTISVTLTWSDLT